MKFKDKTILITGASSGIGKSFALKVAPDKANLILVARNQQKLEEVKQEVEKLGSKATIFVADLSIPEEVKKLFEFIKAEYKELDAVFNNAGIGSIGEIWEMKDTDISNIIDVNIKGMMLVAKYSVDMFKTQKHGHIILTSSVAGLITLPEWSVYVASKWAITAFTDCIRSELKKYNIKVSSLHPGGIRTNFFDKSKSNIDIDKMGKLLEPEEVADAVYTAFFTNKKQIIIPSSLRMFVWLKKFFPSIYDVILNLQIKNRSFKRS